MFNNNKIYKIDKDGKYHRIFFIKGLKIKFSGKNSVVVLKEPFLKFKKSKIICANNCNISIGALLAHKRPTRQLTVVAARDNTKIQIGDNFSCSGKCVLSASEPNKTITIGDDCMFSSDISIRTSDGHSILDNATGEVINRAKDIKIGNHVWISANNTILKGVHIADNCVIGTRSVVTKSCLISNSIYAGVPAKAVKHNINWVIELID